MSPLLPDSTREPSTQGKCSHPEMDVRPWAGRSGQLPAMEQAEDGLWQLVSGPGAPKSDPKGSHSARPQHEQSGKRCLQGSLNAPRKQTHTGEDEPARDRRATPVSGRGSTHTTRLLKGDSPHAPDKTAASCSGSFPHQGLFRGNISYTLSLYSPIRSWK